MRAILLAVAAVTCVSPALADKRPIILAPVLSNTSTCAPQPPGLSRVSLSQPSCCTVQADCAGPLRSAQGLRAVPTGKA